MLREIADSNNHILTFYPFEPEGVDGLKVHKRGWNKASTFSAFCGFHDDQVFSALEKMPFNGEKEQIFLIAYRAICWELYQKQYAVMSSPTMRENIDRGVPEDMQQKIQQILHVQESGFRKGLEELKLTKHEMDQSLLNGDYTPFCACEFVLDGALSIAATGAITPNLSLKGTKLQTLHDIKARTQWLAFGIDIKPNKLISIVFFWSLAHSAPRQIIEELMSLHDKELSEYFCQFFFAYCENTYFSEEWWSSLSNTKKIFFTELMINSNPYYFPPNFELELSASPWKVISSSLI